MEELEIRIEVIEAKLAVASKDIEIDRLKQKSNGHGSATPLVTNDTRGLVSQFSQLKLAVKSLNDENDCLSANRQSLKMETEALKKSIRRGSAMSRITIENEELVAQIAR